MPNWFKIALVAALPVLSHAHTISPFILPESFDVTTPSVSFQSAITIEKFFVAGNNFKTSYVVTQPDGQSQVLSPAATLKRFSVAEFDLPKEGTYRVMTQDALGNSPKYALIDGRWLRVRPAFLGQPKAPEGDKKPEQANANRPAGQEGNKMPPRMIQEDQVQTNAQTFSVTSHFVAETYVTKGKPSAIPAPSNKGFEFKLTTHPSELYAGESLKGQVLFNGKPVSNLNMEVFKGAGAYDRNAEREETQAKTNNKGEVEIKFDKPGLYLITTTYPEANADNSKKPAAETWTYGLTVEVTE